MRTGTSVQSARLQHVCERSFKPRCWPDVSREEKTTYRAACQMRELWGWNSTRLYSDLSNNWCNWGRSGKGDSPDECVCGWDETAFQIFTGFVYWVYLLWFCLKMLFIDNSLYCYYFRPNKEIVHPKMKTYRKCSHPQAIQTVNEFVYSSEQIWRNVALHHNYIIIWKGVASTYFKMYPLLF